MKQLKKNKFEVFKTPLNAINNIIERKKKTKKSNINEKGAICIRKLTKDIPQYL